MSKQGFADTTAIQRLVTAGAVPESARVLPGSPMRGVV